MLSRCPFIGRDVTPTRSLGVTRWISPFLALPHRHEHTKRQITLRCHPSRLDSSFENPLLSLPTHTPFLYKIIVCKILSVLTSINVQTKSDINLGGQGMII